MADQVRRISAQIASKVCGTHFRTVLAQMADEVSEGSGSVQIANKVAEVSRAHSRQSSGEFWYKNLPISAKLLGITMSVYVHFFPNSKTCYGVFSPE